MRPLPEYALRRTFCIEVLQSATQGFLKAFYFWPLDLDTLPSCATQSDMKQSHAPYSTLVHK